MKIYKEIIISPVNENSVDLYTGLLADLDYTGFELIDNSLKAYIEEDQYDYISIEALAKEFNFIFSTRDLEDQNWNALWESNFEPIKVDDFVGIRADFHPSFHNDVQYELIITPKMSFGTGHHATTYMMIEQMKDVDMKDSLVLDFGTGTGVLAILAEKLGASGILAIDNDEWSIDNAKENILKNQCKKIDIQMSSIPLSSQPLDIILANINLNVIMDNFAKLYSLLKKGGTLVLSGLLKENETVILDVAASYQLHHINTKKRENWISILFTK